MAALQAGVALCDAATLWAFGQTAAPALVLAGFSWRQHGRPIPLGLGSFEAACVSVLGPSVTLP